MKISKKILSFITAIMIIISNIAPAYAATFESRYRDINKDKKYPDVENSVINKLAQGEAYDLKDGEDLKDPAMPDIYTHSWVYKRPVTGKTTNEKVMEMASQPYVASVGAKASKEDQDKVKRTVSLPNIEGYEYSQDKYDVSYDSVKAGAKEEKKQNYLHKGTTNFEYTPKRSKITVKHLFQNLKDRNKYENLNGGKDEIITNQKTIYNDDPKTGERLKLDNLFNKNVELPEGYNYDKFQKLKWDIRGFEPERNADNLEVIVPEISKEPFVIRYNRKAFQVKINTAGGSYIPDMTLFYGQTIPDIKVKPTRDGSTFKHWIADKDIEIRDEKGEVKQTITKGSPIDMDQFQQGLTNAMPAEDLTLTAIYEENKTADYAVQFWAEKSDYPEGADVRDRYDFIGVKTVSNAPVGTKPNLEDQDYMGIDFTDFGQVTSANKSKLIKYYKFNKDITDQENKIKDINKPTVEGQVNKVDKVV